MEENNNRNKRPPTHFLALRIQSPALWDHVSFFDLDNVQARELQKELEIINPDYKRILVDEKKLHITLGVFTIETDNDFSTFMYGMHYALTIGVVLMKLNRLLVILSIIHVHKQIYQNRLVISLFKESIIFVTKFFTLQ